MEETMQHHDPEARWYIIHAYSGQEDRVKRNLEQRVAAMDMKNEILQVVVPTEDEVEIKGGQRKPVARKMFPGYILVQIKLGDEGNMDDESWYAVRNTPGVSGFVSVEDERDGRPQPVPLDEREVDLILNQMESDKPRLRVGYDKGQKVRITGRPVRGLHGHCRRGLLRQGEGQGSRVLLRARDPSRVGFPTSGTSITRRANHFVPSPLVGEG